MIDNLYIKLLPLPLEGQKTLNPRGKTETLKRKRAEKRPLLCGELFIFVYTM